MADKLAFLAVAAFAHVLMGVATHVAGVVTDYWFSSDEGSGITQLHMGLWRLVVSYSNGTTVDTDSPMGRREEQILMLAVAAVNLLLCSVVIVRRINVCVGVIAFVTTSLMLVVVAQSYETTDDAMATVQERHPEWPPLKLWWSFYLAFGGIILNIVATVVFLILLLTRGGQQDYKQTQGFASIAFAPPTKESRVHSISAQKHFVGSEKLPESYAGPSVNYVYETETDCVVHSVDDVQRIGRSVTAEYHTETIDCAVHSVDPFRRPGSAVFETKAGEALEFANTVKQDQPTVQTVFATTYNERL